MNENMDKLKYPIGRFHTPINIESEHVEGWIEVIRNFPEKLKQEIRNLSEEELGKTYRPNGWSIAQVVNHCADSHMNSLIRFKLALTEDTPTIKPYFEDRWAELPDSKGFPAGSAIKILEGLHERWAHLLKNLSPAELNTQFKHPAVKEPIDLKTSIGFYAWHCEHHLAHIRKAKRR